MGQRFHVVNISVLCGISDIPSARLEAWQMTNPSWGPIILGGLAGVVGASLLTGGSQAVRRVFFSFHYQRDIWRVNQIRSMPNIVGCAAAGFQDASLWEEAKKKSDDAVNNAKHFEKRLFVRDSFPCAVCKYKSESKSNKKRGEGREKEELGE